MHNIWGFSESSESTFLSGSTVTESPYELQYSLKLSGMVLLKIKSHLSVSLLSVSRYKVAITKHKDLEQTSSSLYSQNNIWAPAVDFSKYIEDNESIDNEVS